MNVVKPPSLARGARPDGAMLFEPDMETTALSILRVQEPARTRVRSRGACKWRRRSGAFPRQLDRRFTQVDKPGRLSFKIIEVMEFTL